MPGEVEGGAVPAGSRGSWTSFLKSIASFNGDLSSLTAPAFILSSQSLVEFSAYWTENQELWVAPTREKDPAKRAALVLRWLINTLHQQYCSRSEKYGNEKKPLNPFLGELFIGQWDEGGDIGPTNMYSEQVSHHPPVTAYYIGNEKNRISLQGYNGQKASFSRTIHIKQIGHSVLTLYPPGSHEPETYLITLPPLHVENLLMGAPFMEIGKFSHLTSSSGYTAKIDYSGKGWVSGKKNSFTAALWKEGEGSEKKPLYTFDGQWSETFTMSEGGGKKAPVIDTISSKTVKLSKLKLAPLEEQDPFESRRAWANVAKSIEKSDMDATSYYKSRIENAQRALRKKEQEENRTWKRAFFSQPDDETGSIKSTDIHEKHFNALAKNLTSGQGISSAWEGVAPEKTNGVWRFDPVKAQSARKPFHEDCYEALGERPDAGSARPSVEFPVQQPVGNAPITPAGPSQ